MNDIGWFASTWLLRTLLAGGVLLLLAWIVLRFTGDPARRQRLAAWSFRAAVLAAVLGFFPAWLTIPIALTEAPAAVAALPEKTPDLADVEEYGAAEYTFELIPMEEAPEPVAAAVTPVVKSRPWWPWLLGAYCVIALLAITQLLIALVGLVRLRRSSKPAPLAVLKVAEELASPLGVTPTVRVSTRVSSPVCFGWRKPVVLLPQSLVDTAHADELHWVLAHELDHLRRGDPRTGLWVGLARTLYFAVPWFWAVRRELRLAQEYLADAAAAAGRPADYAAFLVSLSGLPVRKRVPLGAVAVRAGKTDLYRRVSMLTESSKTVRDGVSRTWSLLTAGGTIAAAVALSGLGFADDKKPAPAREVEVEVVIVEDDQPKQKEGKKDGEKKVELRTFNVKVAGPEEVQGLTKAVNAALEKGDVAAAKEAMAKLQKALSHQPKVMMLHGDHPHVAPVPAVPGVPAPPAGGVGGLRVRMHVDEDVKKLEEKLSSLAKALESVKDSPEAREALERTMAEFKKKIAEAKAQGGATGSGARWVEGVPHAFGEQFNPAQFKEAQAQAAAARDKAQAQIKELEAKLKAVDTDEARARLKAEIERARATLNADQARTFLFRAVDGQAPLALAEGHLLGRAPGEGRLGITIDVVPDVLIDQFDLPKGQGVLITGVRDGSVAAKAGIKTNDVLLTISGKAVEGPENVIKTVSGMKADEKFDVIVLRKGKKETIKDVLIPAPKKVLLREVSDSGKSEPRGGKWTKQNVNVNDGEFVIVAENADQTIRIVGRLVEGKPVVESVSGTTEGVKFSTKDVTTLGKSDQAIVESLLKNVSGGRTK